MRKKRVTSIRWKDIDINRDAAVDQLKLLTSSLLYSSYNIIYTIYILFNYCQILFIYLFICIIITSCCYYSAFKARL